MIKLPDKKAFFASLHSAPASLAGFALLSFGQPLLAVESWQCEHQDSYQDVCKTSKSQQELGLPPREFDWYERDLLPDEIKKDIPTSCGGVYIERAIENPWSELPAEEQPIQAMAQQIQAYNDRIFLFSDVEVSRDGLLVRSDIAALDRTTNTVELSGDIEIREPGLLLSADSANIELDTKKGQFENTRYVLHQKHMFGTAEKLERPSDELLVITEGSYSTCSPEQRDWSISAKKITIDNQKGWGYAHHMFLNVFDVPIFYLPILEFPVDERRMTGFLFPSFSTTSNGGIDIAAPYYLNLAPNYDATLTPRYVSGHGALLETEFRYLNRYTNWKLTNNFMENDKEFEDKRWLTHIDHHGQYNDYWSSNLDLTRVSDDDYLSDLDPTQISIVESDHLRTSGWVAFNSARWSSQLQLTGFQTIDEDEQTPYFELPRFDVNYRASGTPFTLQPVFNNQYVFFASDTESRGHRTFNETGLNYQARFDSGYMIPELKVWNVYYDLVDSNDAPAPPGIQTTGTIQKTIPTANFLAGLYFDRYFSTGNRNIVQTLEPKLYYVYTDYEDQSEVPDFNTTLPGFSYASLFRDNDFIGYDRFSDTHKVSIALENYLINGDNGEAIFAFNIGQSFFMDDREIFLPDANQNEFDEAKRSSSMIATQTMWNFARHWSINNELVYEPYQNKTDSSLTLLKYQSGPYSIFNIGHFFRQNDPRINPVTFVEEDDDTDQLVASVAFPVAQNWELFAATQFDLLQSHAVNNLAGVEYNSCCWTFRFAYLYERDEDDGNKFYPTTGAIRYEQEETIFVEIHLRGLGGFADRITSLLKRTVLGYGDETYKTSRFR